MNLGGSHANASTAILPTDHLSDEGSSFRSLGSSCRNIPARVGRCHWRASARARPPAPIVEPFAVGGGALGLSLLPRFSGLPDSRRMNDTQRHNNFSPLTIEQIQGLVESIQDAFGNDFSRAVFTNHLLVLFEDVPGYETGDVPEALIESAWALYSRSGVNS